MGTLGGDPGLISQVGEDLGQDGADRILLDGRSVDDGVEGPDGRLTYPDEERWGDRVTQTTGLVVGRTFFNDMDRSLRAFYSSFRAITRGVQWQGLPGMRRGAWFDAPIGDRGRAFLLGGHGYDLNMRPDLTADVLRHFSARAEAEGVVAVCDFPPQQARRVADEHGITLHTGMVLGDDPSAYHVLEDAQGRPRDWQVFRPNQPTENHPQGPRAWDVDESAYPESRLHNTGRRGLFRRTRDVEPQAGPSAAATRRGGAAGEVAPPSYAESRGAVRQDPLRVGDDPVGEAIQHPQWAQRAAVYEEGVIRAFRQDQEVRAAADGVRAALQKYAENEVDSAVRTGCGARSACGPMAA